MGRHRRDRFKLQWCSYMQECFGRRSDYTVAPDMCSCPKTCQDLCRLLDFTDEQSPRIEQSFDGKRTHTPISTEVLRDWGLGDDEPHAGVKLTYLGLLSWTRQRLRWIYAHPRKIAASLGLKNRTFRDHLAWLETRGMIMRVPRNEIAADDYSGTNTFLVLDLPDWFPGNDLRKRLATRHDDDVDS